MKKSYTFDDVALVPQFNNIPSRIEPSLETWLTRNIKVNMPIVCANMDTTISEPLAEILLAEGTYPIFHRFAPFENVLEWVRKYKDKTFISCGLQKVDETKRLLDEGAVGVCIDIAHGHSDRMLKFIQDLKASHPNKEIIAGNVCTPIACHDLILAGADAVKVGIGPGAACTTRMVTGFGVPQFSAIETCSKITQRLRVPLIADGGIRNSRDVVLALAAGASTVMMGKLFALTKESSAPKRNNDTEAKFRGQASEDFQNCFYGGLKPKTVAEGVDFWAPVSGSAKDFLEGIYGGLRSALTYGGARSIKELQRKAEFTEVTASYIAESKPRHT